MRQRQDKYEEQRLSEERKEENEVLSIMKIPYQLLGRTGFTQLREDWKQSLLPCVEMSQFNLKALLSPTP